MMTNELEKQFFDAFGIEPKITSTAVGRGFYIEHNSVKKYPQITDSVLLELICIHHQYLRPFNICGEKEFLKNDILECMINILNYFYEHEMGEYSKLKQKVHVLFEEEENGD